MTLKVDIIGKNFYSVIERVTRNNTQTLCGTRDLIVEISVTLPAV